MNFETCAESGEYITHERFRRESLNLLKQCLVSLHYPGYPTTRFCDPNGNLDIPSGPWHIGDFSDTPTYEEQIDFKKQGKLTDSIGRPLHPWINDMLTNPEIGVVSGKGFYWNWGPNYTADPIIVRHDLGEPYVLLIQRADTGHWALPGGFKNEDESDMSAAMREAKEETGIDIQSLNCEPIPIYKGPLADLRATAHAWPETVAIRFDISNEAARNFTAEQWPGSDDAVRARWTPVRQINNHLFGSHRLLISKALGET